MTADDINENNYIDAFNEDMKRALRLPTMFLQKEDSLKTAVCFTRFFMFNNIRRNRHLNPGYMLIIQKPSEDRLRFFFL